MGPDTRPTVERLRMAIHGVSAPFVCDGAFTTKKPVTFVFRDGDRFEMTPVPTAHAQASALQPLLERCKRAPFGDGRRTRFDQRVRNALQIEAKRKFSIENFDPESSGILREIQQQLLPLDSHPISAELYTANVYLKDGHFAPHKDTPRGEDMFGSLVVCLPSQFRGGALVLKHRGIVKKFHWEFRPGRDLPPNQLQWAAFFGDVDHQIERVWSGARVTLTYLLRRGAGTGTDETASRSIADKNLAPKILEAWQAVLADQEFLPTGGILGYPCCHLYHQDARFQREQSSIDEKSSALLKGRDHLVAATALQAGLKVQFVPYLFEDSADETWQLHRFPTRTEAAKLGARVDSSKIEAKLPIRASSETEVDRGVAWLEPRPSSDEVTWRRGEDGDPELPAAAHVHSSEYCPWGYFGNESSYVDFYAYAALHFEIPPLGKAPRPASTQRPTDSPPVKRRSVRKGRGKPE